MLTTTATRLGTCPRNSRTAASGSIAPTCAALIRYRNQQNRTFRFARIWASCLDPEPHREVFRHHRKLRHKHAESLNRRLSWDNHPYADDARRMLKSAIRDCWRKDLRPTGRGANTGARCNTPDNPTGIRPGNNIEDAERGAMEHLLFGDRSPEEWPSTFQNPRGRPRNQHMATPKPSLVRPEDQGSEVEYIIDPITNRKVPKVPKIPNVPDVSSPATYSTFDAADIPGKPLKGYEPQFTSFNPPAISESSEPIFYDGPPPAAELEKYGPVRLDEHASSFASDGQPKPVFESEEYESNHARPSENTISWHFNDGIMPATGNISPDEGAGITTRTTEPDNLDNKDQNKYMDSTSEYKQPFDDLQKYKPVAPEEDDLELMKSHLQYSDLPGYNTFTHLESDGKPVTTEQTQGSSGVGKYQPSQLSEKGVRDVYDEARADPTELNNYESFGYNEPDGKSVSTVEETNDYDPREVQEYQAFRYNEPDGKPALADQEGNYDPLEVQSYREFKYNEPDGKPLSVEDTDVYRAPALQQYQDADFDAPDVQVAKGGSEADASELRQYEAVKHNEPDGKQGSQPDSTAQGLSDFDAKEKVGKQIPYLEPTEQEKAEDLDLLRASDVRARFSTTGDAEAEVPSRTLLESLMSRYAATSDAVDQEAARSVKETKQRSLAAEGQVAEHGRQLTGNYVRDFPDEFARSWTSSFTPEHQTGSNASADVQPVQPALDRQVKLAPKPAVGDLFSKEPQGLETSYEKECAATIDAPIFMKQYGDIDAQPESAATITAESSSSSSETAPEPTLYKILAYDQTMQTINIAETTSNVSKTEPPLTPAEVLLRLSNPAKFFPHFGPLQAQGFEIVSGSGDVLVFRKVRNPEADSAAHNPDPTTASAKESPKIALVNPIDMTGSRRRFPDPAIGRFASPTGFVNYDMPAMQQSDPVRRFLSGIDVRREEPVFSGERKSEEGRQGTKTSLPKRMAIGAAWVAGVSYALGVMGEYFKTGGADGMGPKGF